VYASNKDAITGAKDFIVQRSVDRLMKFIRGDAPDDPRAIVEDDWRDIVSPFTKNEPHPPRKWKLGKWRVVTCVSLVDQVVERCIYGRVTYAIKTQYPVSPAVIGIGFTDEMAENFSSQIKSEFRYAKGWDVSGWDTSVDKSYIFAASHYVAESPVRSSDFYRKAVRNHVICNVNPLFIIKNSTGSELFSRPLPGGILSGSYTTTLYNTLCRLDVAYMAGATVAKAAGDDTVEQHAQSDREVIKRYEELGFRVRTDPYDDSSFEFCSHRFSLTGEKVFFSGWRKTCIRFFSKGKFDSIRLTALYYELRNNPDELAIIDRVLKALGVEHNPVWWDRTKVSIQDDKKSHAQ